MKRAFLVREVHSASHKKARRPPDYQRVLTSVAESATSLVESKTPLGCDNLTKLNGANVKQGKELCADNCLLLFTCKKGWFAFQM